MFSGPVPDTSDAGEPFDALDQLRQLSNRLIELVRGADLDASVAACAPWTMADLALHIVEGWHFWANVVARNVTERGELRDIESYAAPGPADLADAMERELDALLVALAGTDLESHRWTWTGATRPVSWAVRRLLHEVGVHLHDAAVATRSSIDIPPAVAADGIDEFLTWFAASERAEGEMKVGGTVHLHCTDTDPGQGEWFVSAMKEPAATFTREHRKGDAAIRGTAQDILLWLWRRPADVEIIGDEVVARRFRAFTRLD